MAAARRSNAAARALREQQAMELRAGGANYQQIADQLHVSLNTAWGDVQRVLKRVAAQADVDAELWIALELETLSRMQTKAWVLVARGDLEAMRTVLAIQKRRACYLGLDKPQRQEHSGPGGGPIKHEHDFSHLSDAELEAEYARVVAEAESLTGGAVTEGKG